MANTVLGTINVSVSPALNQDKARGMGRNLLTVLGVANIEQAMEALHTRCNGTGVPNFAGLEIGDYLDGISLAGISAPNGGAAPGAWNSTYRDNRIIISGFNFYKNSGDTETAKNHIVFTFSGCVATGKMNSTNDNAGGYIASEIRQWLEGAAGDGSGPFAVGLKNAIGNYLLTIRKYEGNKDVPGWNAYTVFLPTEHEVYGHTIRGSDTLPDGTRGIMPLLQLPIYQKSMEYLCKRRNGARFQWWLSTAYAALSTYFCSVNSGGGAYNYTASSVYGLSPDFARMQVG
jgi:hypothetical protein